jgi:AmpE protein
VFRSALRRWFGVLLWFVLLGPAGALGYRLAALSVDGEAAGRLAVEARRGARRLLAWLEWPVAQLMTFALALVGNFDAVLAAWREAGGASLRPDGNFLGAAARASVRCELAEEAADAAEDDAHESGITTPPPVWLATSDLPELRDAMSLVWRCLLVWLAVLALFVIAGWVS